MLFLVTFQRYQKNIYFTQDIISSTLDEDTEFIYDFSTVVNDIDTDLAELSVILQSSLEYGTIEFDGLLATYTPFYNQDSGFENMFFKVFDGELFTQSEFNLILDIQPVNDPPVIISNPSLIAAEDMEYLYQIVVEDPDNDIFTYMLTNEPNGMIVSEEGIVSWTPTEGVLSSGLIALEVSDGDLFDEQAFEIIVTSVNDAPVLVQEFSNISVSEGSPSETISLLEYFNDPDGDDLDYFVDEDLDFITTEILEDQLIISFIDIYRYFSGVLFKI